MSGVKSRFAISTRHPGSGGFYDVLGISRDADSAEIRAAFLHLAQQHHPDLNPGDAGADERFKQIRRVYEILSDPLKRTAYDERPDRFRISDADVVWSDQGPIVTRPVRPSEWAGQSVRQGASVFRPRWLNSGRFRHESRWLFVAAITVMVILSVIPITLLVRAHRRAAWGQRHSTEINSTRSVTGKISDRGALASQIEITPLEHVINSVRDLRADRATGSEGAKQSETSTPSGKVQESNSRPTFDIIDELDLPFPGWPIISAPPSVPLVKPPSVVPNQDTTYYPPIIYSHMAQSPDFDWDLPRRAPLDFPTQPALANAPYAVDVSRVPLPMPSPMPFRAIDAEWMSAAPRGASFEPPRADRILLPSVAGQKGVGPLPTIDAPLRMPFPTTAPVQLGLNVPARLAFPTTREIENGASSFHKIPAPSTTMSALPSRLDARRIPPSSSSGAAPPGWHQPAQPTYSYSTGRRSSSKATGLRASVNPLGARPQPRWPSGQGSPSMTGRPFAAPFIRFEPY